MTGPRHVAVIDIGKTNAKLALVDRHNLSEIAVLTRPNTVLPGPPWPHFDTDALWDFTLAGLRDLNKVHRIDAISITTHGAAAAWLTADGGLAAPVLDYEYEGPESLRAEYDALRPGFAETGSPRLQAGLNLGAQLFWQLREDPELVRRASRLVTYPQYWAARLTGIAASDVTSLGCHTDLWNPWDRRFSGLVERLGLSGHVAPPHPPGEVLGKVLPEVAAATGLAPATPVVCGIHDSNASLLPHLMAGTGSLSVVSTGTWVIAMVIGGARVALDATRDTLVNVNAFGDPVPSARFMGGREYDLLRGGKSVAPDEAALVRVLRQGAMLLPAVEQGSGPFAGRASRRIPSAAPLDEAAEETVVAFYLALMTAECLQLAGADGPVVVEGPFARNDACLRMLAAATGRAVLRSEARTGTSLGAALLLPGPAVASPLLPVTEHRLASEMAAYAVTWQAMARQV